MYFIKIEIVVYTTVSYCYLMSSFLLPALICIKLWVLFVLVLHLYASAVGHPTVLQMKDKEMNSVEKVTAEQGNKLS